MMTSTLTPEQTPDRKIKEAILAWEVSRRYSKDRILELQNAAKSKMIDHLSHELKTPLAVVSASCALLRKLAAGQAPERHRGWKARA